MATLDLSLNVDAESEALFDFMANPESERLYNPVMRLLAPLMTSMVKRNFSKRPAQLKARLAASHAVPTAQTAAE